MDYIFTKLTELLYESYFFAGISAFLWGLLSILLSPCHLASIPLIIGYFTSRNDVQTTFKSFVISFIFAIGILITIALIGIITYAAGRLMGDVGIFGNIIVAIVFFVVGLYMLDVINLNWSGATLKGSNISGLFEPLLLGLIFGIGLGPCTFAFMAPVLGVVFQLSSKQPLVAIFLLSAFAIGHCTVIVIAGTIANKVQNYLNWTEKSKLSKIIKKTCGILVILAGFYLIYTVV
jgi:cytochrome c-type biogenesis protein